MTHEHVLPLSNEQKLLLDALIKHKHLNEDQRDIVLAEHRSSGRSLEHVLVDSLFITEDTLFKLLGSLRGNPPITLSNLVVPSDVLGRIPADVAEACLAVPIMYDAHSRTLTVAMCDVSDVSAYDRIKRFLKPEERLVVVTAKKSEILEAIHAHTRSRDIQKLFSIQNVVDHHHINRFLYTLIADAVYAGASDIHFSPEKYFVQVRYRCDGLLRTVRSFHSTFWFPLCVQLKVLSNMDITETRAPQDGHFSLCVFARSIDIRTSSHRTIHGENIVLRLLDRKRSLLSLHSLARSTNFVSTLLALLQKPDGMLILAGPTGSGKTTTLYSLVKALDSEKLNIMTLEEPVEYECGHIRQSEVKEGSPLTFSTGMHSILRQDPDIILLGEIRDRETARMALRAAMTGHKVLTTLHASNALSALHRFVDFQIPLPLLTTTIRGIVCQRLVRILCPYCKEKNSISASYAKQLKIWPQSFLYHPKGCSACHFEGYRGRKTIAELVAMTPALEELILENRPLHVLEKHLREHDVPSLLMDGMELVKAGETSLEEISRVVGL